ncbi:hypothetical protein L7F22_033666 [Adiantum nelumboides]|nr:hypothetical protein [Adiantum nelumboides]
MPSLFAFHHSWHASLVASAIASSSASSPSEEEDVEEERMLYSYSSTLQGFAARFTMAEAARLQQLDGVERLLKDRRSRLPGPRHPKAQVSPPLADGSAPFLGVGWLDVFPTPPWGLDLVLDAQEHWLGLYHL